MSGIVLDAGALIALERNDRAVWAALKVAAAARVDVLVPSTALTQVWRGTARQAVLAGILGDCVLASFDDVARQVGVALRKGTHVGHLRRSRRVGRSESGSGSLH